MMRPRFSSGLVVGLAIGMPVGALLVLFALPPRGGSNQEQEQAIAALRSDVSVLLEKNAQAGDAVSNQLRDTLGQLAEERERVKTQMGLFEELAASVSANLAKIETRIDALDRQARAQAPAPAPAAQPAAPAPNRYPERTQQETLPRERRYGDSWE
jgi:septal ring factor EnvC (AmiA/AmiB activator)